MHRTTPHMAGRLAAAFILLFAVLIAASPATAAGPALVNDQLSIEQVDFAMEATGKVPNSEYGHLSMQIAPGSDPAFLNVVARLGDNAPGWLVRNMALFPGEPGETGPIPMSTTVDLGLLGVERGENVTGERVEYDYYILPEPMDEIPPLDARHSTQVGDRVYDAGGDVGPSGQKKAKPQLPRFVKEFDVKNKKGKKLTVVRRPGMGNLEQKDNQCGPAGIANSMRWLAKVYDAIDLCGETAAETLDKLDKDTGRNAGSGIGQKAAIEGKLKYTQRKEHRLPIDIHYQADSGLTDLGESVTVGGVTAKRDGNGGKPTWKYLLAEMKKGQDVELSIDWLDNAGNKTGGHVVAVAGAGEWGNLKAITTNDDGDQGDAGGLRTNHYHSISIKNGYMQLNGFGTANRIKAIYSESPREDATSTPCQCEAAVVRTTDANDPKKVDYKFICAGNCKDKKKKCEPGRTEDHHGGVRQFCSCDGKEGDNCRLVLYTPAETRRSGPREPEVLCAGSCPDGKPCRKVVTKEGKNRELIRCSCEERDEAPASTDEAGDSAPEAQTERLHSAIPDGANVVSFTTVDKEKREPNIGGRTLVNRERTGSIQRVTFLAVDGEEVDADEAGVEVEETDKGTEIDIPNDSRIAGFVIDAAAGSWAFLGDRGTPGLPIPDPGPDLIGPLDGSFDVAQGTFSEPVQVPVEIVELELKSVQPIDVTGDLEEMDVPVRLPESKVSVGGSDAVPPVAIRQSEAGGEMMIEGQGAKMDPDGTVPIEIEAPGGQVFEGQAEGIGYQLHVPEVHQRGNEVPVTLTLFGSQPDVQYQLTFFPTEAQTITPRQVTVNGGENGTARQVATLTTQQLGPQAFGFEFYAISAPQPAAAAEDEPRPSEEGDPPMIPEPMNPPQGGKQPADPSGPEDTEIKIDDPRSADRTENVPADSEPKGHIEPPDPMNPSGGKTSTGSDGIDPASDRPPSGPLTPDEINPAEVPDAPVEGPGQ